MADFTPIVPRFDNLHEGPFAKVHGAFTGIEEFDWAQLEDTAQRYDDAERERGRRSFILRALDEQRSLLAFSELLTELCEAGAPIDVVGSLTQVVRDEAMHVDLCSRVVKALGGWCDGAPEPRWVRSNKKRPLRQRILSTISGSLCVGETLSVAMIAKTREHTSDPVVHALMTRLLRDESFHSRFGWWWLNHAELTDTDRAFLAVYVDRIIRQVAASEYPTPEQLRRPHRYSPFGSISAKERAESIEHAMETIIVPGFLEHGVDVRNGWHQAAEARRAA